MPGPSGHHVPAGPAPSSYKDLGKSICPSAGDQGLARVEGHIVDGLFVLLAMGCDFLHACLVVEVPQTEGAVMACDRSG